MVHRVGYKNNETKILGNNDIQYEKMPLVAKTLYSYKILIELEYILYKSVRYRKAKRKLN